MKKFFLTLLISMVFQTILAPGIFADDTWSDFSKLDNEINYQKPFSRSDYNELVEKLQKNKEKKVEKQKKKQKYIELPNGMEAGEMSTFSQQLEQPNVILLCSDTFEPKTNALIPKGYYKLVATQNEKTKAYYLDLYQGHQLVAKLNAFETDNDFDKNTINFADVIEYKDKYLKIIYGSLKVNLEALVVLK